ncbi:putative uncharacterized protein [Coprobacillus sp. CAG:826]|jgi:spoIIIJ-associated protein|nr:putative uncharacterized protein [Coprobacillus sp. CAG:826]
MKKYVAKTLDDALALAAKETGEEKENLVYKVISEKKTLFTKRVEIEVYDLSDAVAYLEDYLVKAIGEFNITATVKSHIEDEIIHVNIDSDHNSILIGKNGRTLQALNEIAKLAVSSKFKKKYRVLLDINDYKDGKYNKVVYMAKHMAREVQRSHETMTMEAMPADERRMIHNALSTMPHIRTESVGEGKHRQITIRYVE